VDVPWVHRNRLLKTDVDLVWCWWISVLSGLCCYAGVSLLLLKRYEESALRSLARIPQVP